MEAKVAACQRIIQYSVTDMRLILEALNMSGQGLFFQGQWMKLPKNTRLAVYGDSAAAHYMCRRWVEMPLTKEQWTGIRKHVLGNSILGRTGIRMGLNYCLNLNPGTTEVSHDMMATSVEAILGAVHLDGGDQALASVMTALGLTSDLLVPLHSGP
ncbi:hypothetical protein EYB25_010025 [Talaromyces marneffei]|uniref:RNase III domain-containing protein n=2 Tax=Talaromyces marneffei TaxID=37727 RepID=B6QUC3_TALMQ|nr:uncharacterized protein EYB26_009288 [Talaromyces marneffei]EEA19944.1 conserved hypothetical protein [Talaromyces marneffei ATCC 18224]KAE8548231.1 hypothetical protein EYB25_010025 [Talaromyces marneffei]QGA21577.1 hypothetical protein EYB26_009288 [Talaromyces marneffei]